MTEISISVTASREILWGDYVTSSYKSDICQDEDHPEMKTYLISVREEDLERSLKHLGKNKNIHDFYVVSVVYIEFHGDVDWYKIHPKASFVHVMKCNPRRASFVVPKMDIDRVVENLKDLKNKGKILEFTID